MLLVPTSKIFVVGLVIGIFTGPNFAPEQSRAQESSQFTFDNDQRGAFPEGFQCGMTGQWKATKWSVVDYKGARVLGHFGYWGEDPDGIYPVCWVKHLKARDLTLTVQLFPVRPPAAIVDAVHDGAGIVVRFKDPNNYYLMRAVPHESRVRLYKVENGQRTTLGGKNLKMKLDQWHELKLKLRGNTFTLFFAGEKLFHLMDRTFDEEGFYGLWSKPNNVTYFDNLTAVVVD